MQLAHLLFLSEAIVLNECLHPDGRLLFSGLKRDNCSFELTFLAACMRIGTITDSVTVGWAEARKRRAHAFHPPRKYN